jgi:hypothetical protein
MGITIREENISARDDMRAQLLARANTIRGNTTIGDLTLEWNVNISEKTGKVTIKNESGSESYEVTVNPNQLCVRANRPIREVQIDLEICATFEGSHGKIVVDGKIEWSGFPIEIEQLQIADW